ncbi:MAG: hypothetical protein WD023_00670, partial [Ilumatobacteraceae bacterium]
MGRVLGVSAATTIVAVIAHELAMRPFDPALVALAVAEAVLVGRLVLLLLVVGPPSDAAPSGVAGSAAMLAEARSSIAVICTDETLPAVRVALSAAIAAASRSRVLLVGDHPGLDDVAAEHGVRVVRSDGSWSGGVRAALDEATTDHLLLSSASTAVLPTGLRRLASRWDDGCIFVQSDPVAPEHRSTLDHLRHLVLRPAADRRNAASWDGPGSLVTVEAFRALPISRGACANSVLLQRAGLHGRWCDAAVVVEHSATSAGRDREHGGALARGLTWPQRLVQLHRSSDALGPAALLVVAGATSVALMSGEVPVRVGPWLGALLVAHAVAAVGRLVVTHGLLWPGSLAVDDARRLGVGVGVLLAFVVDVALVVRAVALFDPALTAAGRRDGVLLLAVGVGVLAAVLSGLGVLVWRRRLRPPTTDGLIVSAVVGDLTMPVSGLTASVVDVVFDQEVALLGVVTMLLVSEGRRSVMVRAQVVRVVRHDGRFVVSLRLVGTDAFGQHDDYVSLWLASSSSAVELPPVRRSEPTAGRMLVGAGGNKPIRLGSALVLGCVGIATLPLTSVTTTAAASIVPAATTTTTSTTTSTTTTTIVASATLAPPATNASSDAASTTTVPDAATAMPTLTISVRTGDGTATGQATMGQPFTWVVEVRNVSPETSTAAVAQGVDLALELPPNWVYAATVGISPTRCDSAPLVTPVDAVQTVTWTDMCMLAPGQVVTLSVSAVPQAAAAQSPGALAGDGTPIAHRATATLSAEDAAGTSLGSAKAGASATLRAADLAIRLTDGGDDDAATADGHRFVVGSTGRLRADVRNEGPDIAIGPITATIVVPSGFVTTGTSGSGWTCAITLAVVCTHPGPIAVRDALPAITVSVVPTAAAPELVTATATVASAALDPVSTNDVDDEVTPVRQESDLSISSAVSPTTPFAPGQRVDVLVNVVNNGPTAAAGDLVVEDPMPAGVRLLAAGGAGWYCGATRLGSGYTADPDTNGALRCRRAVASIASGVLEPIVVRVQVDPFAAATAAPPAIGVVNHPTDRITTNNRSDGAGTPIAGITGGLSVQAFDGDRSASAGDTATGYDVVVGNQSIIADAGPVVVEGAVSGAFVPGTVRGDGWDCDVAAAAWTCTWTGTLFEPTVVAPGATLPTITVVGAVADTASGVLRHTVTVSGAGAAAPVSASTATPIAPQAELNVTATAVDAPWPISG